MKIKLFLAALTCAVASTASAQTLLGPIIDSDTILPAGSEWRIDGVTYVTPGVTLTIEPGVTVYAEDQGGSEASVLIVTSGATINAVGTPENPIVFTSILAKTAELNHNDVGLWAGVILLGDAMINADSVETADNVANPDLVLTNQIEGLDPIGRHGLSLEVETAYLTYGGSDNAHNGGTMKFVSIRHTGDSLSGDEGDEVQGLTLGGVGNGTTLENIEVFVSNDDGIEIFGGTVNLKNIVLAYAEDDTLDLDQGWRGKVQYLVVLQNAFTDIFDEARGGDNGGEWDGADAPETNTPRALGVISNATFIANAPETGRAVLIRNAGAYQIWNSVFIDYAEWIELRNNTSNNIVQDAVNSGNTAAVGNIFWNGTATDIATLIDPQSFVMDGETPVVDAKAILANAANKNQILDPMIPLTREEGGKVILGAPASGSPALDAANVVALPDDGFFKPVSFVGAFDGVTNWAAWTFSAANGYITIPGWIETDSLGWVYTPSGYISAGEYIFSANLGKYIYIGSNSPDGWWIYVEK